MRKAIILSLTILIIASAALAEDTLGARPVAMGGAFTGLADDVNAIFVNPAGIGGLSGEHASVSSNFSNKKDRTLVGGVERTPYGAFGVGYVTSSFSLDDLDATYYASDDGIPLKQVDQVLVVSYGREFNDFMVVPKSMGVLAFGANLKFSNSRLHMVDGSYREEKSDINADLAMIFRPNDNLSCGVNLKDLSQPHAQGDNVAMGASGSVLNKAVTWSVEGNKIGCEWRPVSALAFRAGRDGDYNTGGFGINQDGFGIDYAYLAKKEPVQYVTVSVDIKRVNPVRHAGLNIE
jgi:hypothetical protein